MNARKFRLQLLATDSLKGCVLALCAALCTCSVGGAEPPITEQDLPRVPAVEPGDALGTFRIKKGFHLELVAAEPKVFSPVALSFDERGRMFVVEMIDYSERRETVPHLGCIRLLEDTDGDGVYDKSTVYADNLPWPTGVFCYDGGIFVIANPDILYLKDTKGTGRADLREVVFSGFSEGVARVNVQEMPNSLIWGLDNRIHGATSGNGGSIRALRHPDAKRLDLNGHDFVIDPRSMTIFSEAGGGQHGLSFDDYGHRFACNNSDHIRLFMYDERYAAANPFYSAPSPLASIAVDGPAAEVYRISLEEPWRVVRTRWRIAGVLPGPVEGGGRSSGYFTGATGITIYRGNAFPSEFHGDAFIGECAFNLLHRKKLVPDDVGFKAERPPDEQNVEFLASTDNWCRPVQCANAPDGTLYVIDMYREIVEHPWSLPDSIKKHLDLNSGSNRGRIYRVVPDGFKQPPMPRLDQASSIELVKTLEHPNGWHRDTAARLLYERQDKAAVPALAALMRDSKVPVGRLHAMHTLAGLNALREEQLLNSLRDPDEHVREHALRLTEGFLNNGSPSANLWAAFQSLASDPSITVRYQLALTLGQVRHPGCPAVLQQIVLRDASSSWMRAAVLMSLTDGAERVFLSLLDAEGFQRSAGGADFLGQLATIIGARNVPNELNDVLSHLAQNQSPRVFSLARSLAEGLRRAGGALNRTEPHQSVAALLARAARKAQDKHAPDAERIEALGLLAFDRFAQVQPALFSVLDTEESDQIQTAAIGSLARFAETNLAPELVRRWPGMHSQARTAATTVLLSRPERTAALLEAIQSGSINASSLSISQAKSLRDHRDASIRELALKVLGPEDARTRDQVVEAFRPALGLKGNAEHGKAIYLERCASCHRLGGNGYAVGPDLVTVRSSGKEKVLVNLLDPNREVAPSYIAFEIETKDGESSTGIIANETTSTITVRQALGKTDVISRTEIEHMRGLGQSMMPEGLEQGLKPQDLADLLEYVITAPEPK